MTSKGSKISVLLRNSTGDVVGAFSNLKKLCEQMETETGGNFVSYSKLSKMRINNDSDKLSFTTKDGTPYTVHILTVI